MVRSPHLAGRAADVRVAALVACVLAAAWISVEVARPFDVLAVDVVTGDRPRTALLLPATGEEGFEVRYEHSYNHFTIRELFSREGDEVVVVGQHVNGNGAGIGEVAGETAFVDAGHGWSRLTGLQRPLGGPLRLRVGAIADHRLIHRCRDVALVEVVPPGEPVQIGWARVGLVGRVRAHVSLLRATPDATGCADPAQGSGR
ncbi:MAG: DUF1850 domain-containing protein [Egibacteraceae bacterium]